MRQGISTLLEVVGRNLGGLCGCRAVDHPALSADSSCAVMLTASLSAVKPSMVVPGPVAPSYCIAGVTGLTADTSVAGRQDFCGSVSAGVIEALVPCSGQTLPVINCQAQHRNGAG